MKGKKEKILSQIQLKYFGKDANGNGPIEKNIFCEECKKVGISVGTVRNADSDSPTYVCEYCAIVIFQNQYGYESFEVAKARRRRMFDVTYLLKEMFIDEFIKEMNIKSVDDIEERDLMEIFQFSVFSYNKEFNKKEKTKLEEMENQKDIEAVFRKIFDFII